VKQLAWMLLLLVGCAPTPTIQPADHVRHGQLEHRCRSIYPQGKWQLVHTIHGRFRHGRQAVMTGVVVLSSNDAGIHCVLMSLEGFVLFDAEDRGTLTVHRAVPPFDSRAFARGVMDDIRLMFLAPESMHAICGQFQDGTRGCRFITVDKRTVDVTDTGSGRWRIRQNAPSRTIVAEAD
jgi:hypothetical protein